ncbi:MAG TPA: lipid-A-disaccharide synthase [Saprospiraceae bacterium]|mgnify:CR=1 FL=1|nr:lipid-A-disaccharide synthase [Saprospiraceae bacterium]
MKYYIIAGEASGDLHGSNLMSSLNKKDMNAQFRFWGGDKMLAEGGNLVTHYRNMAFMGFLEVVKNLRTILGFLKTCKKDILTYQPDVLVLIDYPGFNLRIAKWAKKQGIKVVYYITPQVWAWHKSRVYDLGKYTDKLLVILPFEADFFKKYGFDSVYVGHPLLDAIEKFKPNDDFLSNINKSKPIISLLPGSRKQEISVMLPIMLEAIQKSEMNVIIAGASAIEPDFYQQIISKYSFSTTVHLIKDRTYDILSYADFALVSSGTATLETALFGVPQIVCYKGNAISYLIAKQLVDLKYISLVNLIADKEIVKELIQNDLTKENLLTQLDLLQKNKSVIKNGYDQLKVMLGSKGASDRAASEIYQLLTT